MRELRLGITAERNTGLGAGRQGSRPLQGTHSPGHFETGLGPGALCCHATMLAPEHTSPWATTYKETVWNYNCVHAQLGKILDPKDTRRPKHPTATFEEPGVKNRVLGAEAGYWHAPCTEHHLRGGQKQATPLAQPLGNPTFTLLSPAGREHLGNLVFVLLLPACWGRGPNQPSMSFLSGLQPISTGGGQEL